MDVSVIVGIMNGAGALVRVCSLGLITHALFEVGGKYRRSI
jgi:hypothetical protein